MRTIFAILCISTCLRVAAQGAFEDYIVTCRTSFASLSYMQTQTINDRDSTGKLVHKIELQQIDSVYEYSRQSFYTYDLNQNLTGILSQTWSDTGWTNTNQTLRTFNLNGAITHNLYQYWNQTIWANQTQVIYNYDSNLYLVSDLTQHWSDTAWVNNSLNTYTYDSVGRKSSLLFQTWNQTGWGNYSLETFTHDSLSLNIQVALLETWHVNQWQVTSRDSLNYDPEGNLISRVKYVPDDTTWIKVEHFFQTFSNDTLISAIVEELVLGVFLPTSQSFYTYEDGRLQSTRFERWYESGNWIDNRCFYQYLKYTHTGHEPNEIYFTISAYPNPFEEFVIFSISEGDILKNEVPEIHMYNLYGQLIAQIQMTETHVRFKRDALPAGVYFYKAITDHGKTISSGKLIAE